MTVKTLFHSLTVFLGRLFRPKKPLKIYFEISNTHVRGKLYMNFNVLNFTSEHVSILSRIHIIMVMLSFVFQLHNDINMLPTNDTLFSNSHFFFNFKSYVNILYTETTIFICAGTRSRTDDFTIIMVQLHLKMFFLSHNSLLKLKI